MCFSFCSVILVASFSSRNEVGEEPEAVSFSKPGMKRRKDDKPTIPKRFKKNSASAKSKGDKSRTHDGSKSNFAGKADDNARRKNKFSQQKQKKVSFS